MLVSHAPRANVYRFGLGAAPVCASLAPSGSAPISLSAALEALHFSLTRRPTTPGHVLPGSDSVCDDSVTTSLPLSPIVVWSDSAIRQFEILGYS